jgi:hypothetical protein
MKVIRRTLFALALVAATVTIGTPSASAADSCYGSSCVGLDPSNTTCANDAKSIASKDIRGYGLLEMRWSRSCNTGWARYVNYQRSEGWSNIGVFYGVQSAYVSAWTDQGTQDNSGMSGRPVFTGGSAWWGRMVDFSRPEVCIGARLYLGKNDPRGVSEMTPLDWTWGPCVR